MIETQVLLLATFGWPLLLLLGVFLPATRRRIPALLGTASWPVGALMIFGRANTAIPLPPFLFYLDVPGGILLAAAAVLWSVGGFAIPAYFPQGRPGIRFTICWLLVLIGSLGVFLASDLIGFLVFYALVSLPAYGLVAHDGTSKARRAGKIYLGFALLGENLLLLAFVLLAQNPGVSELHPAILGLLIAGFSAKIALVPLHFWMPPSYTVAPIPAAAVLSGAAVKAGIIGLLRFLPIETTPVAWGEGLVILGFIGAFYGVLLGMTQQHPKSILAYSSISQMGFLVAVLGMGISTNDSGVTALVAFYGAHHVLAKGALFLAVGACAARSALSLFPAAVLGLGLAGLPLTGGALAKLAVKAPFGYGPAFTLATLAAIGTAMLMTHFLFRLIHMRKEQAKPSLGKLFPWLAGAVFCIALPWIIFPVVGLSAADIFGMENIWKTLWPVLIGGAMAVALRRIRLPHIPVGDMFCFGSIILRPTRCLAQTVERLNHALCCWPIACSLLLVIVIVLFLTAH